MTGSPPPPFRDDLLSPHNGGPNAPWSEFFNELYEGDEGTSWTPTFVNLTEVGGAATVTAVYSRITQSHVLFSITVTPATNVSATAGSTYITGFPLQFVRDTVCNGAYGNVGVTPGHVVASNNRIYVPGLSAVTVPITFTGIGFAR